MIDIPPVAIDAGCQTPPWDEAERLAALDRYGILDTGREAGFDDIAELAADILDAPIAVVNFIAADRQWFKAEKGIGTDTLPLDVSICRHAILRPGVLVVPDLRQDSRFVANPLVDVADGLRFYAGALLETPDGLPLGTVCVLDRMARPEGITDRQERALKALAMQTMAQLELRRATAVAREQSTQLSAMFAHAAVGLSEIGFDGRFLTVNDRLCALLGRSRAELLTLRIDDVTHADDMAANAHAFERLAQTGESFSIDKRYLRPDGRIVWANSSVTRLYDEAGRPRAALAVTADISLRKAEERRQAFRIELETRLRSVGRADEIIGIAAEAIGRELTVARVGYGEIDAAQAYVTVARDWIDGSVETVAGRHRLEDFGPPIIAELMAGRPIAVDDVAVDDRVRQSADAFAAIETRAVLAVPLVKADCFTALLFLHHPLARHWTADDIALAAEVAERTWSAVERARAEAGLRRREARLRAVFDQAAAGFARTDLTGRFIEVNDRYCEIVGHSRAQLLSLTMQDLTHPDDLRPNMALFNAAAAGGESFEIEKRYAKADGSAVWVRNSVSAIRSPDGRVEGILAVSVDLTERLRAEAALRESETRLRALMDNLPMGLVYQATSARDGSDRQFIFISDNVRVLSGFDPEDVIADPTLPYQSIDPAFFETLVQAERHAVETLEPLDVTVRYRHGSGEMRWCRIVSAPRVQSDARLIWDGIQIDVTDQKAAEDILRDANDGLERRVAEAISKREVAEEALRQAQKMEAMGQLTGGVAHDFNNLLTPILGALDLLQRRGTGDAREQRLIGGALHSAERAKTLVQRLLAFARRQPLQTSAVDVAKLVEGMAELLASTTGPAVQVEVDVAPDLPPAKADANQLEMALLNLGVNARDAMPGGGTLRITATRESVRRARDELQPGDYVRLSVADTGTGMDAATLARAVEPFFSTKGIGKGTGLGLSMVHGLAAQLGGTVTIRSAPARGTVVELWLPVSAEPLHVAQGRAERSEASGEGGLALLVDDEEAVRASTADMLGELGYRVIEADSAEAALLLVGEGMRPDLIVSDHLMPGMSGVELVAAVREILPRLPALIVSGYAESEGIAAELPRLTKPFRSADLAAQLSNLDRGKRQQESC